MPSVPLIINMFSKIAIFTSVNKLTYLLVAWPSIMVGIKRLLAFKCIGAVKKNIGSGS